MQETNGWSHPCHVTMHNHITFSKQNIQVHLRQEPRDQLLSHSVRAISNRTCSALRQLLSISVLQDNTELKILQEGKKHSNETK